MKKILGTMTFAGQANIDASRQMLQMFGRSGGKELDTAYLYNDGKTEVLLGELLQRDQSTEYLVATKVNPWNDHGLEPDQVRFQFEKSLERLQLPSVDLLYLHSPDLNTPIEQTLEQCQAFFNAGKFTRLGLSNYAAWQVAEIVGITRANGWVEPSVYQGMYNALTRDVEAELLPCLRHFGISFYAYNPLAGGMLTGKHRQFSQQPEPGRFADNESYLERYWKQDVFAAMDGFVSNCESNGIIPAQAALRWLSSHSSLSAEFGDGVILGASSPGQLDENLAAFNGEALEQNTLNALDDGWESVRSDCFPYFRT